MIRFIKRGYWFILFVSTWTAFFQGAIVIHGDSTVQGESFVQPLSVFAHDRIEDFFYVGTGVPGAQSYALAYLPRGAEEFVALAPENAHINGFADKNPLYDMQILHLVLLGENYRPVVVPDGQFKNRAFFVDSFTNAEKVEMLATEPLVTPAGEETKSIVGLAANNNDRGGFVFAAITNKDDDSFGSLDSGIALLAAHFVDVGEGDQKSSRFVFNQLSRATDFNNTIDQLKIGGNVIFTSPAVDMHWDNYLSRLYIAVQLKSGNAGSDGIKALVVGRMVNNQLVFESIAPDAVFSGTNKIVGAIGSQVEVSLHKVRTMLTSTSLNYVIVLGGNGDAASTKRSVFALPLVSDTSNQSAHGTLAKKDSVPQDVYGQEYPYRFISRGFKTAATVPADAVTSDDGAAKVGGGPLQEGDIQDIFVMDDAVFVSVLQADAGFRPGVFYSRAIFDSLGRVISWTAWQRASGAVNDPIFGASLEHASANFLYLTGSDPSDPNSIKTVKRTDWGGGDDQGLAFLNKSLAAVFPRERGGITGLFDMQLSTTALDNISLLIATGCQTVALAQTSTSNGGIEPIVGDIFETNKIEFLNGTIDQDLPDSIDPRLVIISGGDLSKIGFIRAAQIAAADQKAWLFVGGDCGLAVLRRETDGIGWNASPGLGSGFDGLKAGTSFKIIGDYRNVRKLLYDDDYLYVLTDRKLDRIDLANSDFSTGDLSVVTVADPQVIPGLDSTTPLFDVIVSEKFALLATGAGLFRIQNGKDVAMVESGGDWQQVVVADWCGPITQLVAISTTVKPQDVARYQGGNVYALAAYVGKNRAQVNRFAIAPVEGSVVDNNTVKPFPDIFVKNTISYFVSFGLFRDWIATDGAIFFHEINRFLCDNPIVQVLWAHARSGVRFLADKNPALPIILENTCYLWPLLRNSATGSWLLAGNNELYINE